MEVKYARKVLSHKQGPKAKSLEADLIKDRLSLVGVAASFVGRVFANTQCRHCDMEPEHAIDENNAVGGRTHENN